MQNAPRSTADPARLIDDLCDTVRIDGDDLTMVDATALAVLRPRWEIVRMDDNGHRFVVAAFSGYAKARARLAEYEALSHKQT